MNKKIIFVFILSFACLFARAQYWVGLSQDNYSGVLGAHLQPASIASAPMQIDVLTVGADFSAINLNVLQSFSALMSDGQVPYEKNNNNFLVNAYVQLPSILYKLNKHSAFSLSTSLSGIFHTETSDGSVLAVLKGDLDDETSVGFDFSDTYLTTRTNVWLDISGTYAYRYNFNRKNALSGGLTLKLINGVGGGYLNLQDLTLISYNGNQQLDAAKGRLNLMISDGLERLSQTGEIQFFSNPTLGASIGFEYHYIGNSPRYKLKLGTAIIDWGEIKYTPSSKSIQANANVQNVNINQFYGIQSFEELSDTLQTILDEIELIKENGFRVSLPTKFVFNADYHITKDFYVNGSVLIGIDQSRLKVTRVSNINRYFIVPRLERKKWGVSLPMQYDNQTKFTVGIAARYKFAFLSVNNVLSGILTEGDVTRMNLALGIRIVGLGEN